MSGLEADHRRITLRRAQGMHLAAPLFALDEILQESRLVAPPPRVEPGNPQSADDAVSLALPYMPMWPELAAVYDAPTLTLEQALAGGSNIAIIGQPGTGKTVALAQLASLAANSSDSLDALSDFVPFLLHVADLKLPIGTAKELLNRIIEMTSEYASMLNLSRVEAFVQSCFRSGRALLLLDGFDELTSEGQAEVTTYLKQLIHQFPKIRIVTTGAPEYLDGLLNLGFAVLSIAAWNVKRQARFVLHWSELWSRSVGLETWSQEAVMTVDPYLIGEWVTLSAPNLTPLELTLKIWAACAGDGLGHSALDAIASHVRRLTPNDIPEAALETLAMQVMLTAQPMFDPRKARAWIKDFELPEEADTQQANQVSKTEPLRDQLVTIQRTTRSRGKVTPTPGLLGRLASTGLVVAFPQNRMRFTHPVMGGYLAGRALSGYKAEQTLLDQPDWIGKLLTMRYFAAHAEASSLVNTLLQWSRLPMHRPLLTAARWLRDAPRSAAWRGQLMTALADLMQATGLPLSLRGQAVAALVSSNDPDVTVLFQHLLNNLSTEMMQLAALGSGAVRDEKAIWRLEAMLRSPGTSARCAACLALVAIGTTASLESVGRAMLKEDENVRRAAAEALANDPEEGHAMLRDGATMSDILLRRATVFGLGRIPDTWAAELLEKMRVEDDQWVVQNAATNMLDARNRPLDPHVPRPLVSPSESPWLIAFAGKNGVGVAPGVSATNILLEALKSTNSEERLAAMEYLKREPSDGVINQIYTAMFGPDSELREAAFLALWEVGASGYKLPDPAQFGFS